MTNQPKLILIDADGVLIRAPKLFSHAHAQEHSFESRQIEPFFAGDFQEALVGRADLKELIVKHRDVWQWYGDPAILLAKWFEAENYIDQALLADLQRLRQAGVPVFMATDQEKYRAAYIRDVMFPGMFDGFFVSCELGHEKNQPEFFAAVLKRLMPDFPELKPAEIMFFDDSEAKVLTARNSGIHAEVYTDRGQIERLLE